MKKPQSIFSRRRQHASNGEQNPWVKLEWNTAQTINKIVIYDRPDSNTWATGGTLTFSDGSQLPVTGVPNDGSACVVTFSNKTITWVKFQISGSAAGNVGLSEFQVFDTQNVNVALHALKVSSSSILGYTTGTSVVKVQLRGGSFHQSWGDKRFYSACRHGEIQSGHFNNVGFRVVFPDR